MPRFSFLNPLLAVGLICLTAALPATTLAKEAAIEDDPSMPQAETVTKTEEVDPLIEELEALVWEGAAPDATPLSYAAVLEKTIAVNLDIALSDEKIKETEAKKDEVEGKRALLFFKYLNADDIEGSAESDVKAAEAHRRYVEAEALKTASEYYFDTMRSIMATYIAHQAIRKGLKQLQFNQSQFLSGEATSFEVMQTKTQLMQRYQEFLEASLLQESASLRLTRYLKLKEKRIYPQALDFRDDVFQIEPFHLVGAHLAESDAVTSALAHRPELDELAHKRAAIENMVEAYAKKFDKVHVAIMKSTLRQLALRKEKAELAIQTTAAKAYNDYRLADKKLELANRQLDLASTALRQVQISQQAGFSSNKDVLDAQVAYAHAQVNEANALINYNMSQVTLLYEMGTISRQRLLGLPEPTTPVDEDD